MFDIIFITLKATVSIDAPRLERRRRKRLAKMRAAGAETMLQYRLANMRRRLMKIMLRLSPRILCARLRQKKFANIISLGANCEVAFRFCLRWGFVDSSLFSWANVSDTVQLAHALKDLDKFCSGPLALNAARMWVCGNTGIRIHGRLKNDPGLPPVDAAAEAADKADLLGRVAHLREKLRRYAADEASTLFIFRIPTSDVEAPGLADRLNDVENAIRGLDARNWSGKSDSAWAQPLCAVRPRIQPHKRRHRRRTRRPGWMACGLHRVRPGAHTEKDEEIQV